MPVDYKQYCADWKDISKWIRFDRADSQCEWIDHDGRCAARNYEAHPITGSRVVLTVAHLDHDIKNNDYSNLMAMCQLHHNRYDAAHRAANRKRKGEMT